VERGPCQAKNPFGPGFSDGACMPMSKCKETLRGIVRLNFPVVCGVEILTPIICCPLMSGEYLHGPGQNRESNPLNFLGGLFGKIPGSSKPGAQGEGPFGPYGLNIPGVHSFEGYLDFLGFLPPGQGVGGPDFGGGPSHQGFPGGHGVQPGNNQGQTTGVRPHNQDTLGGQNGRPTTGDQGNHTAFGASCIHGLHVTSHGSGGKNTGQRQPHQGSPGGSGRPSTEGQGQGSGSRPQHQGSQGSHKVPTTMNQGKACGQAECPPQDSDDIIHLIDPRTGRS
ncbi:unnamed protein product, partial [Ixodes hexagonus]